MVQGFFDLVTRIDHRIFFFFQGLQRPWLDYFLAWPTYLGNTQVLLTLLIPSVLFLDRKNGYRSITALTGSLLLADYFSPLFKVFFHRPRPHVYWEHVNVIFSKPMNDAFPSGHTMVAFAAAFVLSYYYPKKTRWFYVVAIWAAITRIYVGAHYPSDLLGGAPVGILCGFVVCHLVKLYEQSNARVGSAGEG